MQKDFKEIDKAFSLKTKHLPVVERMICDINRRLIREKTLSFFQPKDWKLKKSLTPQRKSYLGQFYERLEQDLERRRVKSRIRQQIKKILEKRRGEESPVQRKLLKPHLPHRFAAEDREIEKLYGVPGRPVTLSDDTWLTSLYDFK